MHYNTYFEKLASVNYPLAVKIAALKTADLHETTKNFIEGLPDNDLVATGGGALIGHEIGKRFGHKNIGTAVGAGLGYAASGNWGDIAQGAKGIVTGAGEGASNLLQSAAEGTKKLFGAD